MMHWTRRTRGLRLWIGVLGCWDAAAQANLAAYEAYLGGLPAPALAAILAAFGEFAKHHPGGAA